jgi:hypothetical protein
MAGILDEACVMYATHTVQIGYIEQCSLFRTITSWSSSFSETLTQIQREVPQYNGKYKDSLDFL